MFLRVLFLVFFFLFFILLNYQELFHNFLFSQLHADDSYIFTSFPKYELSSTISRISFRIGKISSWSDSMFLKFNLSKFDLIYLDKSSPFIESLPSINISSNPPLTPSSTIHSLGFIFDFSLPLIPQIKSVAKSYFFHLRRIKQLKLFLDNSTLKLLVFSLFCPA